jgi:hypothetical protein
MAKEYYNDIDISLEKTSTGDTAKLINMNAVKASIYNSLFVRDNENFLEEDFGYSIQDILMEIGDEETTFIVEDLIRSAFENDERIGEIDDININFKPESNEYVCTVRAKLINSIEPQDVELILKKTR